MTVDDLVREEAGKQRAIFKTAGDLVDAANVSGGEPGKSDESRAMELLALLDNVERNYDKAKSELRAAKSKIINGLSRESKQVLVASGDRAFAEMSKLETVRAEIEKRLLVLGDARKKTTLAKALDRHVREYRALKKRADDVVAGREKLDETQRRTLLGELSAAELRVRESMR